MVVNRHDGYRTSRIRARGIGIRLWKAVVVCVGTFFATAGFGAELIADFEGEDFGAWEVTGEAFGAGPAEGTLPGQGVVSGFMGQGLVNSFHNGNEAQGSLTSPAITIERDFINFVVGGGDFPREPKDESERARGIIKGVPGAIGTDSGECTVNLVVEGEAVRSATGIIQTAADNEHLSWYTWDVKDLRGKSGTILILDKNSGPFGHITVDHLTQDDERKMPLYANPLLTRANSSIEGARARAEADPTRPTYHVLPPATYSNGPHGPVYHNGAYHLFYQICPWGWGNGGRWFWGHWRSKDLVYWEHLPLALWPSYEMGEKLVMAGSSAISDDGTPMIFYSSAAPGRGIEQWAAIGDDDLINWKKYAENPLFEGHGVDPWLFKEAGRWYMVLGGATPEGKGGFTLHGSDDLLNWEFLGYPYEGTGERKLPSWEVPNFFKLGNKWVLVYEPHGPTRYLTGTFDFKTYKFEPEAEGFMDYAGVARFDFDKETFIDFDGHFVGCTSVEDAGGRRIHWGLVTGWDPERVGPYLMEDRSWNGCMTLPRELTIRPDGKLIQKPIPELASLRGEHYSVSDIELADASYVLNGIEGDTLEILVEFAPAGAKEFGLKVRRSKDGERSIKINWDGELLNVGRHKGPEGMLEGETTLKLHIFLDRSVMEVFANDWACFTDVIYPPQTDLGIELFASGGAVAVKSLDVWRVGSIW